MFREEKLAAYTALQEQLEGLLQVRWMAGAAGGAAAGGRVGRRRPGHCRASACLPARLLILMPVRMHCWLSPLTTSTAQGKEEAAAENAHLQAELERLQQEREAERPQVRRYRINRIKDPP